MTMQLAEIQPRGKRSHGRRIKLYHVSPNADIQQFRPRWSPKLQQAGLFATRQKKAIFDSWAGYVASKKYRSDPHGRAGDVYKNLTLYTLEVPWEVFQIADRVIPDFIEHIEMGPASFGAWGWDSELFVPERLLDQVRIVSRQTLPTRELSWRFGRSNRASTGRGRLDRMGTVGKSFDRLMSLLSDLSLRHRLPPNRSSKIHSDVKEFFSGLVPSELWGSYDDWSEFIPREDLSTSERRLLSDAESQAERFLRTQVERAVQEMEFASSE